MQPLNLKLVRQLCHNRDHRPRHAPKKYVTPGPLLLLVTKARYEARERYKGKQIIFKEEENNIGNNFVERSHA